MGIDDDVIQSIVSTVLRIQPQCYRVILYGSAARDEMTDASDIDLLIVIREVVQSEHSMALRAALECFHYRFDLLVVSISEYLLRKDMPEDIVSTASATGRVLHSGEG
jgi:predicted nucleotidyltransferase